MQSDRRIVRKTKKPRRPRAQDGRRLDGGLSATLLRRAIRAARADAIGEERDMDLIAAQSMQRQRAARPQDFVVGVRNERQNRQAARVSHRRTR